MLNLGPRTVALAAAPASKQEAIRAVGNLLVEAAHVESQYVDSMLEREAVANTFLGSGIAIPHGLPKAASLIHKTGVAVMQVPEGVTWNRGETVHLVIGIAASSDEHLSLLGRLTSVLSEPDTLERLRTTSDPDAIVEALTQSPSKPVSDGEVTTDLPARARATIQGARGLHARPATTFVQLAKDFSARVRVRAGNKVADGKSMAALLRLSAGQGTEVIISADGRDAEQAVAALRQAVEDGLGEAEDSESAAIDRQANGQSGRQAGGQLDNEWRPREVGRTISGISASAGIAIGPVHRLEHRRIAVQTRADAPQDEERKLRDAIAAALIELDGLYKDLRERAGSEQASIFRAHAEFLSDEAIQARAHSAIGDGFSAGWSWRQAVQEEADALAQVDDPMLASRAVDLRDVGKRVLRLLAGVPRDDGGVKLSVPSILLARDIDPSDTAQLDPTLVLGLCTAGGGPNSHAAIIARSLDIAAVVGLGPDILELTVGTHAIVDGTGGHLYIEPSPADVESAEQVQQQMRAARDVVHRDRFRPALTADGVRFEVAANVGGVAEAQAALAAGAEGIGLTRSEFLFMDRETPPSEDEQTDIYRGIVAAMGGLPVVIRTLDVGGDKRLPYLDLDEEDNPFLGVRGLRLCLRHPALFATQLRAIHRAAEAGPVRILLPMVTTLDELEQAKHAIEKARAAVGAERCELGVMVEVPAVAAMAAEFAAEVDFFSIGTNDLTQYVMAMDRLHPALAQQSDGLHPALLRTIDQVVQAAHNAGAWVGVCGGVAGDPLGALVLAGLGVDELSVSVPRVPTVKASLRDCQQSRLRKLAQNALASRSAEAVRQLTIW